MREGFASEIEEHGFAIVPNLITREEADRLIADLSACGHAARNLFEEAPNVVRLARSPAVGEVVEAVLGSNSFAVRGIFFDKTPDANWNVAWHQDLTIAAKARLELPEFGPWSEKAGIPHVQPPTDLLERMLTIRIHLDDCGLENGPLRVIPGSHRSGRLDSEAIASWRNLQREVPIVTRQGDGLVMRPLLLHASSRAQQANHRRVIHLEFAAEQLPVPLQWHAQW